MSRDMINDELFGHARGSFTGAAGERVGRLEAADGGTLLIDEVGDLPPEAQVRLLRFLQAQEMSRIGENKVQQLSVRVLAATWHDLDKDVANGTFREDLLHRLRVGAGLRLPPLARRENFFHEMLPALLKKHGHGAAPLVTRSARDALERHQWPGNLRELAGVLDEVVALADGDTIRLEHLPPHFQRGYLELPLHARAIGFLLDEVDGGGLPDEHLAWRIKQVTQSLAAAPLPPSNEQLAAVGRFLSLLDDNSEDHRRAANEATELLRLDQEHRRATSMLAFWASMLELDAPPNVKRRVQVERHRIEAELEKLQALIAGARKAASIDSNPWLRLFREVQALPALRGSNGGELAKAFIGIFNMLKLVAPAAIDQLRADAASGGFNKVRERVARLLRESGDHDDQDEVLELPMNGRLPSTLSRDEWLAIAEGFPTQRAAADETGFDPKTITKYLKQHGIANSWKPARARRPSR